LFDPNIIFTALAFIISLVTLWFTHLKGPDIELCRQPEIIIKDWGEEYLQRWLLDNYVLNHLDFEPIQLVFANNGSRSRVITDIKIIFIPSNEFKEIYRSDYIFLEKAPDSEDTLPVPIPEGGNHVLKIKMNIHTINWNEEFEYARIGDLSNLRNTVSQSVEINRNYLEKLIILLRDNSSLGIFKVDITYLARRWLRIKINTKTIVEKEIKCNNKKITECYSRLAKNWKSEIVVNKILEKLPSDLNSIIGKINDYYNILESQIRPAHTHKLDDFKKYTQSYYSNNNPQRAIIEVKQGLHDKIEELADKITNYNYMMSLIQSLQGEANEKFIKEINEERTQIRIMTETILSELRELRTKIIKGIQLE